ncbi:MAG: hypothetical protein PHU85_02290 [Phycisphaerae bacterium]|nr:hypothetical protein [Phycisphaerae bacterium]
MHCLFAQVLADQPTAAGVLYRCQVCGLGYRTYTAIDRVVRECQGTAEQWAATRREMAVACVREAVPPANLTRALEQLERCLPCTAFLVDRCRIAGCGRKWLRILQSERCATRTPA